MSEQASETLFSGIKIPKILAGALAAVSVAVLGSFLGVAGTLVGAALASVVGSVGTEIYERSLRRGAAKLQQTLAPTFIKAPAAVGTPEVAAATEDDSPSHTVPEEERSESATAQSATAQSASKKKLRWGRVAVLAGAIFALALGGIWVAEQALGEPLTNAVTGTEGSGTSLNPGGSTTTPAPSSSPSATPSASESASPAAGETPSVAPTTTPSTVVPSTTPTDVAPTTGVPLQSADPGTGGGGEADTSTTDGASSPAV